MVSSTRLQKQCQHVCQDEYLKDHFLLFISKISQAKNNEFFIKLLTLLRKSTITVEKDRADP